MKLLKCPIDWLFFDVGNVLMDERPWLLRYHDMVFVAISEAVPELTRKEYEETKLEALGQNRTIAQYVLSRYVPDSNTREAIRQRYWPEAVAAYYELSVPAEGITEVLEELRERFRLGVIANQDPRVYDWMERHDLASYFELAVYDCDLGFGKPDERIFRCALDQAACPPRRAVMIGDRIDNDVAPARALGLWTIRLRAFGDYARHEPATPTETPDITIADVRAIPSAVEELCRKAEEQD